MSSPLHGLTAADSFMLRKLFSLVSGSCCMDNPDSAANQEVLLPGHLYGNIIRERLEIGLNDIRTSIVSDLRRTAGQGSTRFFDSEFQGFKW